MKASGVLLALSIFLPANAFKFNWDNIKFVYAFGDSYTFVQGTEGHPAFSFIGDAFNFSFTPRQLLSDKIIPRNVFFWLFYPIMINFVFRLAQTVQIGLNF